MLIKKHIISINNTHIIYTQVTGVSTYNMNNAMKNARKCCDIFLSFKTINYII